MSDATSTQSWPPADPAARREIPSSSTPLDQAKVEALLAQEWERFTKDTPESGEHNARASKSLPLGVTSSFQHWDPYPISITSARGAYLTDVDGRQLLDLSMGFGAMLVGHLNPVVVEKVQHALAEVGTLFVTPSPTATRVAERYQERFGLDMLRFTQSGTESLMYAVRAARAYTQRKAIIKIEGGYHGGYDALSVSVKPELADAGPADAPTPEVPFDVEDLCAMIKRRFQRGHASFIVVVAEGAKPAEGTMELRVGGTDEFGHERFTGVAHQLGVEIEKRINKEVRTTVLGHVQRGGTPTPADRVLATRYGVNAADAAHAGEFGQMVSLRGAQIALVPLAEAVKQLKRVPRERYDDAAEFFG